MLPLGRLSFSFYSIRGLGGWQPQYGITCPPCGHRHWQVLKYALLACKYWFSRSVVRVYSFTTHSAQQDGKFWGLRDSGKLKGKSRPLRWYVNTQKAWSYAAPEGYTSGNNSPVIKLITRNTAIKHPHKVNAQIESKQVSSLTPVNAVLWLEKYNNFICYVFMHSIYICIW